MLPLATIRAGDAVILAAVAAPAFLLAIRASRWQVPYLILTWALGPEIRRLNDWLIGEYQDVTLLSLIPMAATLSLLIPIFSTFRSPQRQTWIGLSLLTIAVGYGSAVGYRTNGAASLFEGVGIAVPVLFVPYMALRRFDEKERALWLGSLVGVAALVATYGWYQYIAAPPWDELWLVASGMSQGQAMTGTESFRVFSTLNSAGPLSLFLAASLAVGVADRRWRRPLGLLGCGLIASCLALSMVRLGWIMAIVGLVGFVLAGRGVGGVKTVATTIVLGAALFVGLPMLPGAQAVSDRASTFGNLNEDGSVNGRIEASLAAIPVIASNLTGFGYGSTGVGGKLGERGGNGGFDNGYVDISLNLGLPVALVFFAGCYLIVRGVVATSPGDAEDRGRYVALAVAISISYAAGLFCFNILGAVSGVTLWLVVGAAASQGSPAASHATIEQSALADLDKFARRARRIAPLARDARRRRKAPGGHVRTQFLDPAR